MEGPAWINPPKYAVSYEGPTNAHDSLNLNSTSLLPGAGVAVKLVRADAQAVLAHRLLRQKEVKEKLRVMTPRLEKLVAIEEEWLEEQEAAREREGGPAEVNKQDGNEEIDSPWAKVWRVTCRKVNVRGA
jgi:hypothetical protein